MTGRNGLQPDTGPILVVEDDVRICETIRWVLEDEGFVVETATDGEQALELATNCRPRLVVLDMMLPGVDGAGVAEGLRAAYSEPPPILVVTADGRPEGKARRVGAYAYLAKLDELVGLVRRGLGTHPTKRLRVSDPSPTSRN